MKKSYLASMLLLIAMTAMGQKPVIQFEKKTHDFGKIQENGGKVTTVFKLKNTGMTPLVINRVQTSCGCTAPAWEKAPIEPGCTGTVSATYTPMGRPGKFTKSVTVYTNATEPQVRLLIKGEVIPIPMDMNAKYPIKMDQLGLKNSLIQFNNISKGKESYRTIAFANIGTETITIAFDSPHPSIVLSASPATLAPKQTGRIHAKFLSAKQEAWGPVLEEVYVIVNGNKTNENKIQIRANIVEDFSKLSKEQRQQAPILELSTRKIDLGILKSAKKTTISIRNIGIDDLEIRRIINNSPDVLVRASKATIGAGKKADIKIELKTKNFTKGTYRRSFSIQTNDPENVYNVITLTWKVE